MADQSGSQDLISAGSQPLPRSEVEPPPRSQRIRVINHSKEDDPSPPTVRTSNSKDKDDDRVTLPSNQLVSVAKTNQPHGSNSNTDPNDEDEGNWMFLTQFIEPMSSTTRPDTTNALE